LVLTFRVDLSLNASGMSHDQALVAAFTDL
jgi:hypothetical protein